MSEKHNKVFQALNYIFAATSCVSVSTFASLVGILIGVTNSPVGLEICTITALSQLSRKKRKKHQHIVLIAKTKLNTIEIKY